jgi:hypothetical protein
MMSEDYMADAIAPQAIREADRAVAGFSEEFSLLLGRYRHWEPKKLVDTVAGVLETALSQRNSPRGSYVRALARGLAVRRELEEEEGGSLSAEDTAHLLGMSKPSVLKRFKTGRLLGWRDLRQDSVRFPAWQFTEQGLLPGLERIMEVLKKSPLDPWGQVMFFLQKRHSLTDQRPLDFLRQGRVAEVEQIAWENVG